ncbi:DUF342 domain-containing protein [Aneurinibacillus tyrosinisolvens]|uniref:DUF342 domain-containing protein n=1 Tax=Aneurinibacillus tyrosinisolvens TaxID=1443435 RepID=UPI00063FB0A0|nr:FapA family protein [Aneurinibacillus tyrosinisolvens]
MGESDGRGENTPNTRPVSEAVKVNITEDRLQASLEFSPEGEIQAASYNELIDVLKNNKVTYGIKEELVRKIADGPNAYRGEVLIIAEGTAPIHGNDGSIEFVAHPSDYHGPTEREDGSVDFYNVLQLLNVEKGQLLAKKHAPARGTPGRGVTGDEIAPKDGKEARFKIGKNVLLDQEKSNAYAAADGQVTITEQTKINVFSVFEVNGDVDFSVGNIDFVGNVVIRGNVHPGFTIKAGGDIKIAGGIESATLEAKGSIEIIAGIIGHDKGSVTAGIDVKVGFIQNAAVKAGNDVIVSQTIMHSTVSAGRNVICKATKGLIVGGTVQSGERVVAKIYGNANNTPTSIEVGAVPELREEYLALKADIKTHGENVDKSEKGLRFLDQVLAQQGTLTREKKTMQIKLMNSKLLSEKKLAQARMRSQEIEEKLTSMENARVECLSIMYSGTKLVFGNAVRFIKENCSRSVFVMGEDGRVTSTVL